MMLQYPHALVCDWNTPLVKPISDQNFSSARLKNVYVFTYFYHLVIVYVGVACLSFYGDCK